MAFDATFYPLLLSAAVLFTQHPFVSPHALLTHPPSLNHGNLAMASKELDAGQHFTIASYGIVDKAFFDGDHGITPWEYPGQFDHKLARDLNGGRALHPCGCNAGLIPNCAGVAEEVDGKAPAITEWEIGSSQTTAWNAYANHGGGYVYMLCKRTEFDECRSEFLPSDVNAATEIETDSYLDCVWSCFESNTLEYAPNSQRLMYRNDACSYAEIDDLTKLGKNDHVWRTIPIPDTAQIANGNEGKCQYDYILNFSNKLVRSKFRDSFGDNSTCDTGADAHGPRDWNVVDKIQLPSSLEEGEYLLSWRWDVYTADQMWTSCAALNLVNEKSGNNSDDPFDETQCDGGGDNFFDRPTSAPTTEPAPSTCQNIEPLLGNWGGTNGIYNCDFYENQSGNYCAHETIAEACCFCGGGEELKCEDKKGKVKISRKKKKSKKKKKKKFSCKEIKKKELCGSENEDVDGNKLSDLCPVSCGVCS